MARAALKLGVRDVAKAARVSPATVTRVETEFPANATTLRVLKSTLEAAGVDFLAQNGGGAGVRLMRHFPVQRGGDPHEIQFQILWTGKDFEFEREGGQSEPPTVSFLVRADVLSGVFGEKGSGYNSEAELFATQRRRFRDAAEGCFRRLINTSALTKAARGGGPIELEAQDFEQ
jgi:hypothetical protein